MQKLENKLPKESIFRSLSPNGLISFSDYIFLVTLLSSITFLKLLFYQKEYSFLILNNSSTAPTRHFEIAFQMFDLDGNGNIDIVEFENLQRIIRNQTSIGQRHRDTRMTGSVIKNNSTLNQFFFGRDLSELLTCDKFIEFQSRLQAEVIRMEFENCEIKIDPATGTKRISEVAFCEILLAYAGFSNSKIKKILKRVSSQYAISNTDNDDKQDNNSPNETPKKREAIGITLKEYEDFFKVLRSIQDIDMALKFYRIAGASIDKSKCLFKVFSNIIFACQLNHLNSNSKLF
jgi:calcium uptake protein 1, mitochondrial